MKKILYFLFLSLFLSITGVYAQTNQGSNPSAVGIDGNAIPQGSSGILDVIVENNGSDPMPSGTFRVSIGIDPTKMSFVDPSSYIAANYPDWTVLSLSSTQLVLINSTGEMSAGEAIAFEIQVKALPNAPLGLANLSLRVSIPPTRLADAGNTDNSAGDDIRGSTLLITAPLPVTLTSFTATQEGSTSLLKWATTAETNSDHFEIQRSLTGKDWNKIGTVASNGESVTLKNYTFTDANPVNGGPSHGENLYRLKMVDKDATFAYSRIQSVFFDGQAKDLSVYPNPSADFVYIRDYQNVNAISIIDMKGNVVYRANGTQTGAINVKNMLAGMYAIKIARTDGNLTSQKIVIVK